MGVSLWSDLASTPYGRVGKLIPRPDAEPYALHNRVTVDHWNAPTGTEVLQRELPLGKRCFRTVPGQREFSLA